MNKNNEDGFKKNLDEVHSDAYPIDLHLDSINLSLFAGYDFWKGDWQATKNKFILWFLQRIFPKGNNQPHFRHVSGPNFLNGGYGGACVSAHASLENLVLLPFSNPWKRWQQHQNHVREVVSKSADQFKIVTSPTELREARSKGRKSIILSVEGAHVLGPDGQKTEQERLERLSELSINGVVYLTLNHYRNTDISEAGYRALNPWKKIKGGGLSKFGTRFVHHCIDEGILLDLTHTSMEGIVSVCKICSERNVPAIVSHGASRTITRGAEAAPSRHLDRALTDEAICEIVKTGGCISVILAPYFLRHSYLPDGTPNMDADLAFVVDYYEQMAMLIQGMNVVTDPWRHLSFGSDFDGGISSIPTGMHNGADLPELTRSMLEAGWPRERIKNVYSKNFLRVWDVARSNANPNRICD